jgi:hypothetical protein
MNEEKNPKTPEEVLEVVESLERKHQERGVHIARLRLWAQVALQGMTPDEVRGFSTREADLKDSMQQWLRTRRKLTSGSMQMGRATFGMSGPPGPESPEWVRHVHKTREGRFAGNVYTVAILHDESEVRLDPPLVIPPDMESKDGE